VPRGQDLSKHQRKIVDRYYQHRDTIALSKLGEIVSELYLAESDAARQRLWNRASKALDNLVKEEVVTAAQRDRVMAAKDPAALAELVNAKGR